MGSLSIRGVDAELTSLLKKRAEMENKSVNQLVLETMQQHVGLKKHKQFTATFHDLDVLFGKWSQTEYETIERKIASERQIDDEIWE